MNPSSWSVLSRVLSGGLVVAGWVLFIGPAWAGMSYTKVTTLINPMTSDTKVTVKVLMDGPKVRTEEDARQTEGSPGTHIYDFDQKKVFTVMNEVKLYMEDTIAYTLEAFLTEPEPQTSKRYQEAKDIRIERIRHPDEVIQGHPVAAYEIKVFQKTPSKDKESEEKMLEHYWKWVRDDLQGMPIRFEFPFPNEAKKVIEYLDIEIQDLDPGIFKVPEGYIRVQPY